MLAYQEVSGKDVVEFLELLREKYAGSMEVIELELHDSNVWAIALYERLGFVTVRRVEELGFSVMKKEWNSFDPLGICPCYA